MGFQYVLTSFILKLLTWNILFIFIIFVFFDGFVIDDRDVFRTQIHNIHGLLGSKVVASPTNASDVIGRDVSC